MSEQLGQTAPVATLDPPQTFAEVIDRYGHDMNPHLRNHLARLSEERDVIATTEQQAVEEAEHQTTHNWDAIDRAAPLSEQHSEEHEQFGRSVDTQWAARTRAEKRAIAEVGELGEAATGNPRGLRGFFKRRKSSGGFRSSKRMASPKPVGRAKSPDEIAAQASGLGSYHTRPPRSDQERQRLDTTRLAGEQVDKLLGVRRKMNATQLRDTLADVATLAFEGDIGVVSGETARDNYLYALRVRRRAQEDVFRIPTRGFIADRPMDKEVEAQRVGLLQQETVELEHMTSEQKEEFKTTFPSGTFLYHGAETNSIVSILDSGELMSSRARQDKESPDTKNVTPSNQKGSHSGWEGISWSMNDIDVLPGDRFHMAGFIAAPEAIMGVDEQLTVPSVPAPYEVIQLSKDIDPQEYYATKTQLELYAPYIPNRASNDVTSNIAELVYKREDSEKPLLDAWLPMYDQPGFVDELRQHARMNGEGVIELNPNLMNGWPNQVPVASIWLQAAIDNGRFQGTPFEGMRLSEVVKSIDEETFPVIRDAVETDKSVITAKMNELNEKVQNVAVPVESMYFVAPAKDAMTWMKVIARTKHKPKGILLYDEKEVRLENWQSPHVADQEALTTQLRKAIELTDKTVRYSDVLGQEFNANLRTANHHLVQEGVLGGRRAVHKDNNGQITIR